MGFRDFFTNRTETTENHHHEELRSRYYKTTKQKAIRILEDMLRSDQRIDLLSVSEELGEITAEVRKPRKAFMVISVIMVYPYRTAIDFTVTTQTKLLPIDGGYSKKEILRQYKKLDKQMEFVGVGLGEGAGQK
jgi:6-phosphogluconate dehydrogenase